MDKGLDMSSQPNSSSDFVRKLFKMLEDPSYREIVRWADGGETFVVLENEKFTKMVLPKHFKHSNFASFVRQLNKYDFHKVRQNSEDSVPSPYGPNAWEFKHPEFQENKKDLLDNIKRKAPAPRKPAPSLEEQFPSQQVDLLSGQLVASQRQIQHLSESYNELAQSQVKLLQHVIQLQKFIKNHEGVMQRLIYSIDAHRRGSQLTYRSGNGETASERAVDENVTSPLQEASELLREFPAENLSNEELEQITNSFQLRNNLSTAHNNLTTHSMTLHPTNDSIEYNYNNDLENLVYPIGNTNGIDPIRSEHIHNIPYAPPTTMLLQNPLPEMVSENPVASESKKDEEKGSMWGVRKANILLVEDDKTCSCIGTKFLEASNFGVETAFNGMEAISKINQNSTLFDLILMDIIMPHLDGVSATVCIKELRPNLPIIAMTSNIRAEDIQMYYSYGMTGVLPKPFTKEGMIRTIEKYLFNSKGPVFRPLTQISHNEDFRSSTSSHSQLNIDIGQISTPQIKDETHSEKNSTAVSSWDPSNQLALPSPVGNTLSGFLRQTVGDSFSINSTLSHSSSGPTSFAPPQQNSVIAGQQVPQRRGQSEMRNSGSEDSPEKRSRLFSHQPGGFVH